MLELLRQLGFNQISFWLGFLAGSLFWFLISGLRSLLPKIQQRLRKQAQAARSQVMQVDENRLGNDTLRRAQAWHLAAPLFSLDEIIIEPRLLAPPIHPDMAEEISFMDITDWAIPYLPDWPELASYYSTPSLSLAEALMGGSNLAIIGQPGIGKSVALAHLATQIIRGDPKVGELEDRVPLLLHAADLLGSGIEFEDPLAILFEAVHSYVSPETAGRLPYIFSSIFDSGRALLLLDGLDELAPAQLDKLVLYLGTLLENYPAMHVIVSASPDYLGGLITTGFFPIPLKLWNDNQREQFILRWSGLWTRRIAPLIEEKTAAQATDPLMLIGWLLTHSAHATPLELTLKVWAAFSGDSLGPGSIEAIEAYLRRMTHRQSDRLLPALEQLAYQITEHMQTVANKKDVEAWLSGSTAPSADEELEAFSEREKSGIDAQERKDYRIRAAGSLPDFIENGLIKTHLANQFRIAHPVFTGYLTASHLTRLGVETKIASQFAWVGKSQTLNHLAILDGRMDMYSREGTDEQDDAFMRNLLTSSRWLRGAPKDTSWATSLMQRLAACLENESTALGIKARALTALVVIEAPKIDTLLRKMLSSPQNDLRQLACLGCGMLRDKDSVEKICTLVADPSPHINQAALLSLVAIGNKRALEEIAYTLLHGDKVQQKAAAEAFANFPEEGYLSLKDGSVIEDASVRRAVAFGLARIDQPCAIQILEKLRSEDEEWHVQDAAIQALNVYEGMSPRIPKQLPPLNQTSWLISFAAARGMGVSPGKSANDLLYKVLGEGNELERLAAIHYLGYTGDLDAILPLTQIFYSSKREIQEAALIALWFLFASRSETSEKTL